MMDDQMMENEGKFNFDNVKNYINDVLETSTWDIDRLCEQFNNANEIIKTAIEHGFRYHITTNLKTITNEKLRELIDLSVVASQRKLCSPTTPIFLINDILNNLTIDRCSDIFSYLEDSSHVWKSELFYSSVRNYLLRMCNDLLKRLSKSQNTVFSGRIHVFLAKLFPLNEKSGLNLMSHFSENATRYTTSAELFDQTINKNKAADTKMELDEDGMIDEKKAESHQQSIPIDYNLYRKFWSLQDFFSKPNTLYDRSSWKQFINNTGEVLDALKSYKLDDINSSAKKNDAKKNGMDIYFAKYLTSPKLLDLQLNDSNFRRQVLVQFLITFQYLNAEVKFKSNTQVLAEEHNTWIKNATTKVYQLLKETPPEGESFASNVQHILEREEIWNKWKNEGCPNLIEDKNKEGKRPAAPAAIQKPKRAKPMTSDFFPGAKRNFANRNNPEMAKLWNINHDNLDACKDPSRQFLPQLRDFFEEPIEQLDPANQVEKQYLLINRTEWSWKALRLLARSSPFYFNQNQNVRPVPEYLESMCHRLAKEFQTNQNEQAGTNDGEKIDDDEKNEEESVQLNDETAQNNPTSNQAAQSYPNTNVSTPLNGDNNESGNVETNIETKESNQMTYEERLMKLKQEFQMDEDQEDSQSSIQSNTPPRSVKSEKNIDEIIKDEPQPFIIETIANNDAKTSELVDETFMDSLSESIKSVNDWKKLAQELLMDEDTIAFIESENSEVKKQCKKILQLWKEREEKKAFKKSLITALKLSGHNELATELESKFL